mgnify:CR=1 FL=1
MPQGLGVQLGLGGGRSATASGAPASFENIYSMAFDGSNDYVGLPDVSDFNLSTFSWSVWFKLATVSNYKILVDRSDSNAFEGYTFFMNTDKKIRFCSYKDTDVITGTTVISAGTWYHAACTHTAGADRLYVNGALEASGTAGNFAVSSAEPIRFASSDWFNLYTDGNLDEISFYDKVLSAGDVDSIWNDGNGPTDLSAFGPAGWWRMGDGATWNAGSGIWTIPDVSGNGNAGTSKNMEEADVVEVVP